MSEWHKTMLSTLAIEASSSGVPERLESVSDEAQSNLGTSRVCMIAEYFGEVPQCAWVASFLLTTAI